MKNLGYYNGKIGLIEEMSVPMTDRGCYFGDGVYDATYSIHHIIWDLDAHVDRFFHSASLLKIKPTHTPEELKSLLRALVCMVDDGEQFVYFQWTRGSGLRNHLFPGGCANLWVMLTPKSLVNLYQPARMITMEDTRYLHCNIKTINLLPAVMGAQAAAEAGCEECLFHRGNVVTECAHSNAYILINGTLITHPANHFILNGISRQNILLTCRKQGIPYEERPFTLQEAFEADELMYSSAGSLCVPVQTLDGKPVGGKNPRILRELQDALLSAVIECCGTSPAIQTILDTRKYT
ncbi:MAG TPA: D-amino acid aminotransferase [Clostridiales bacterium]|nr:D-amino acid aminotransferase [Clostridiales bacterium]HCG36431.1 D-amino acid aminotransferase [Clostridiales bacterium]